MKHFITQNSVRCFFFLVPNCYDLKFTQNAVDYLDLKEAPIHLFSSRDFFIKTKPNAVEKFYVNLFQAFLTARPHQKFIQRNSTLGCQMNL